MPFGVLKVDNLRLEKVDNLRLEKVVNFVERLIT